MFDLFIIHRLENGGWRVEYRTLSSVHPIIDYPNTRAFLEGMANLVSRYDYV